MERFKIERIYLPKVTVGSWYWPLVETGTIDPPVRLLVCKTLELPWLNNERSKSCIPEGLYVLHKMQPGFGRDYPYFRFEYVKDRTINKQLGMSSILVHRADHVEDLLGCIGVGSRHVDFENDGVPDIADSKKKLTWMTDNLPDTFELEITQKPKTS